MKSAIFLIGMCAPFFARAQVVAYEADGFPEDSGWVRSSPTQPGERWIDDGWLVQAEDIIGWDPFLPEKDTYRKTIAEFAGASSFFMEWRVQTDGPREGIPAGAPALITASGNLGIQYHFTITRDLARLIDPNVNVILFDIVADIPHDYRLEVREKDWLVFIDGQQVNSGTAAKNYPTSDAVIAFRAQAYQDLDTTRWDYIRYGVIPDDGGPGDMNCDGSVNGYDITPFITALVDPDAYGRNYPACNVMLADTNADGSVNGYDIQGFIDLLK